MKASASSSDDENGRMVIRKEKEGWKLDFSGETLATPLLDTINFPVHMKNLSSKVYYIDYDEALTYVYNLFLMNCLYFLFNISLYIFLFLSGS